MDNNPSILSQFSLVEELKSTGNLSAASANDAATRASLNGSIKHETDAALHSSNPPPNSEQLTILLWQQEADAISQRLAEIKSVKTYQVQVEAVRLCRKNGFCRKK